MSVRTISWLWGRPPGKLKYKLVMYRGRGCTECSLLTNTCEWMGFDMEVWNKGIISMDDEVERPQGCCSNFCSLEPPRVCIYICRRSSRLLIWPSAGEVGRPFILYKHRLGSRPWFVDAASADGTGLGPKLASLLYIENTIAPDLRKKSIVRLYKWCRPTFLPLRGRCVR